MFERFTAEARLVVVQAEEHARRLGHDWLGCEHILLAVAGTETPAGTLLRENGAGPAAVEHALVSLIGHGPDHDSGPTIATYWRPSGSTSTGSATPSRRRSVAARWTGRRPGRAGSGGGGGGGGG